MVSILHKDGKLKKFLLVLIISFLLIVSSLGVVIFVIPNDKLKAISSYIPFLSIIRDDKLDQVKNFFLQMFEISLSKSSKKIVIDLTELQAQRAKLNKELTDKQNPIEEKEIPPESLKPLELTKKDLLEGENKAPAPAKHIKPRVIVKTTEETKMKPSSNVLPPMAPAPKPVPTEKVTEMALLSPTAVKPVLEDEKKIKLPPPPPPETGDGTKEHKRGLAYYKGDGVAKDFGIARKWFLKAAENNHASAQYNLGIMSYLGQGVDKSFTMAANWFRKAANQDHALAQYNLGFLYYEGKGLKKDNLQAFMWIDRAASQGDSKAKKALTTLEKVLPKDILKKKK